jgi:translation initiation factor IF-3
VEVGGNRPWRDGLAGPGERERSANAHATARSFWRVRVIASEKKSRVNDDIDSPQVRLIDEEGGQLGVVTNTEARQLASERGFDLVEIAPNAEPPVCRLMDYGKFLFQANKKRSEARKKQQNVTVKEVKFRPGTEEGDYQTKLRNLRRFLDHGDKTKVTMWFRGREMRHQELGLKLLQRVEADLDEMAKVEQMPKLEGRRMSMVLTPRK